MWNSHYLTLIPDPLDKGEHNVPTRALRALAGHAHHEVLVSGAHGSEPAACFNYVLMPGVILWTYLEPHTMPPDEYAGPAFPKSSE